MYKVHLKYIMGFRYFFLNYSWYNNKDIIRKGHQRREQTETKPKQTRLRAAGHLRKRVRKMLTDWPRVSRSQQTRPSRQTCKPSAHTHTHVPRCRPDDMQPPDQPTTKSLELRMWGNSTAASGRRWKKQTWPRKRPAVQRIFIYFFKYQSFHRQATERTRTILQDWI